MTYIGKVKISDPIAVQSYVSSNMNGVYKNGSIICEIPELGLEGQECVLAEYGLSIPYYRVQVNDEVLLHATIGEYDRFFYIGLVDCGKSSISPTTLDQMIIKNADGKLLIDFNSNMKINGNSTAKTFSLELGATTKIEFNGTAQTITVTCGATKIEMSNTSVKINDTALEVLP